MEGAPPFERFSGLSVWLTHCALVLKLPASLTLTRGRLLMPSIRLHGPCTAPTAMGLVQLRRGLPRDLLPICCVCCHPARIHWTVGDGLKGLPRRETCG